MILVFDVLAVSLCVLGAFGALLRASRDEMPLQYSVFSLIAYAVFAVAALSCGTTTELSPPRSSEELCVSLIEVACLKTKECVPEMPIELCLTERAGCSEIKGITELESVMCLSALKHSPCSEPVPLVCVGIAEPRAGTSPGPGETL